MTRNTDPHPPHYPGSDPELSVFAEGDTELVLGDRRLVVVGYTHRTAPLSVRARFAVAREDLPPLARRFKALPGVGGCALVATCNRLEAYLEIRSEAEAEAAFVDLVGGLDLDGRAVLARSLLVRRDLEAVHHLFRVASGLDAMVLGDAQILGQVKEAYRTACNHGTAGPQLHKVFHMAFRCAKKVRSETSLGAGAHSVAGSAVSLLSREIGGLRGKEFLLVGLNQMTEAAGRRLAKAMAGRLVLCNRTAGKAAGLASEIGAKEAGWSDLWTAVAEVDAVLTCTGATTPIFGREQLTSVATSRPDRPLTVIDMAVPPDVEPPGPGSVASPALCLLDLEDVAAYQRQIEARRCQASASGEKVVSDQVVAFGAWLRNQVLGPKLDRIQRETDEALARELERRGRGLPPEDRLRLEAFGRALIKKFLGAVKRVEED